VPRVVSFLVLLAVILLVGAVFFRVMAQFLVPLFLACVLLVVFQPLHRWLTDRLPKRPRLCALLTTVLILLAVLLPLTWLGWKAYSEFYALLVPPTEVAAQQEPSAVKPDTATDSPEPDQQVATNHLADRLTQFALDLRDTFERYTHVKLNDEDLEAVVRKATGLVGTAALGIVQTALGILVGLFIMVIALYYFLADGPAIIEALMRLSPLEKRHELELFARFVQVSRSVVLATLLSAAAQGVLAGAAYYFVLPSAAPIFLLTALTMVLAIVPFVGAAGTWVFVCAWVYLYGERMVDGQLGADGNPIKAIVLAVYCAVVVSGIDNVIKPLVLHGQSNLHPLLALMSVLGGVTVLGPVGILVGPMLVSFLQALLNMFHKELHEWGDSSGEPPEKLATAAAAKAANAIVDATADKPPNKSQQPSAAKDASAKDKRKQD